jgi:uncharacterized OsmC-like protein
MIQIQIDYQGELRCAAVHEPSGARIETDAPTDNHGRGESFSPTDLVATALGACMATVLGIAAERKNLSMNGLQVRVTKHMATSTPRRIGRLEVRLEVPLPESHPERPFLEATANGCPVHQSLHPDIEVAIDWQWLG